MFRGLYDVHIARHPSSFAVFICVYHPYPHGTLFLCLNPGFPFLRPWFLSQGELQ